MLMNVALENINVTIKPLHAKTALEVTHARVKLDTSQTSQCINVKVNFLTGRGWELKG